MTKNEALKLALEALEYFSDTATLNMDKAFSEDAIAAIKEVLAQPEQEPVQCWKCGDMDAEFQAKCDVPACGMKETKQKPVANYCKECLTYNGHQEGCSQYTTPPQRTWVGLTDEEIKYIEEDFSNEFGLEAKHSVDFAQAIEAKLKEKNT